MATILIIGTLDTKGEVFAHARELMHERGHNTIVLDAGIRGQPSFAPDISAESIAEAGGSSLQTLRNEGDRGQAIDVMTAGVIHYATQFCEDGTIDGVFSLGGGGGTTIAATAMQRLPIGMPKVLLSTVASGDTRPFIDSKDITLMYSVVDIVGLNRLVRPILANAVGAICGMVEQSRPTGDDRPMIAASMFGVTTPCVEAVREKLENAGYEVLVFHATGTGGQAMESLIAEGYVVGVADVTTTEWCDEVVGGKLSAGPDRLTAAGKRGVPQVVSCGALDMVNFGPMDTVPDQFRERNLYKHNANVTLMRTTAAECEAIGRRIAANLNQATGPTTLLLPAHGVSMIDAEGQPFYDPEADRVLFDTLREACDANVVTIKTIEAHVNDAEFAEAVVQHLREILPSAARS